MKKTLKASGKNYDKSTAADRASQPQQYRSLIDKTNTGFVVLDEHGVVIDANDEYVRFTGHGNLADILGKSVLEWTVQQEKDKNAQAVRKCLADGKIRGFEINYADGKGGMTTIEINATVEKLNDKPRILTLCRDISERRRLEEAIKESEKKYRELVSYSTAAIYEMDFRTNRFTSVNDAMCVMTEYTREELLAINPFDLIVDDAGKTLLRSRMDEWLNNKVPNDTVEYKVKTKSGRIIDAMVSVKFMLDEEGKPLGSSDVAYDITDRKRAEEALKLRTAELERSNQELEEFAYVASHDLKEPLRTITCYCQLLAERYKGRLDDRADEFINFMVKGSGRMQELIDALLKYSRLGTQEYTFKTADFNVVLDKALENLRDSMQKGRAVIERGAMPSLPVDMPLMVQVFQNILANAICYRGKEDPVIKVSAQKEGKKWLFMFKDNGIGIEKEFFGKIFNMFQRLHTGDKFPGTGIGLSVCKKIVERHGGRIWVESEPGKGSTFKIILPSE